jgi:tetratricopeptide (TPR) repeat protein
MDGSHKAQWLKRRETAFLVLVIILVLAAYWPIQHYDFIDFDDNLYITENARIKAGLTWENVLWTLEDVHAGYWQPLSWLSLMLDYTLYGLHAPSYHWSSLTFHLLNIVLLFIVLRRMTGEVWKSLLVVLLFALHPLNVESVAWIAERKNVLSTFFCFLTLYCYALYVERRNITRYLMVILSFLCGLLSKPILVTLPLLMMLMDFWPLKRCDKHPKILDAGREGAHRAPLWSLAAEKVPLLMLSAVLSLWTIDAAKRVGALIPLEKVDLSHRLANVSLSYVSYIRKIFIPNDLAVFYPYPETFSVWAVFLSIVFLVFISVMVIALIRQRPCLFIGWSWYLIVLCPVIGIIQAGEQAMADRYVYLSTIGIFIMISWGAPKWPGQWKHGKILYGLIFFMLAAMLFAATSNQLRYWENTDKLFEHTIQVTNDNILAYNARGNAMASYGKLVEAIGQYQAAIRIHPTYVSAHNNLGLALAGLGRHNEAILHYLEAIRLCPDYAKAYNNMGISLEQTGNIQDAERFYYKALQVSPDYANAHNNLGVLLAKQGKWGAAISQFGFSLAIDPYDTTVLNNMGTVLINQGNTDLAVRYFEKALKLDPGDAVLHNSMGIALVKQAKFKEALRHFIMAARLDPRYGEARKNIAAVLSMTGQ